jgi:translocation and assembly module TamB
LELRVSASDGELSGRLQIFDGLFRRRVDLRSDIVRLFKSRKIDFKASEFEDMPWQNWKLKVSIDSGDPFNVRNNLAEGSANLRLVLGGTLREMRLSGNVDIVRGQFAFNNRQFAIRSGSIVFQNPSTNVPNYDIRAETEIGDYRIFVKLFGGPDEQKISYSSDPVLSEKDILSVISFGLPSSSEELKSQDPTRAVSLTGISFVTGQLQDQIEGRLSRDFGVQRFSLGPAFFEETGRTELQLMVGTDLIRNRLGVNYSQFLSAEGGQKVELDLKMSRNLSLIGSWREVREEGKSTDDFGGDFRFRFEVE